MHHVVAPVALIVAPVLEDILSLAVLQAVLLLTDELIAVGVFLVDVLILLFFRLRNYYAGGKNSVS